MRQRGGAISAFSGLCSLAVIAVAHFDPDLAGRLLAAIERADDCFCRLQLWFVLNILQNRVKFDPRSLIKLIAS